MRNNFPLFKAYISRFIFRYKFRLLVFIILAVVLSLSIFLLTSHYYIQQANIDKNGHPPNPEENNQNTYHEPLLHIYHDYSETPGDIEVVIIGAGLTGAVLANLYAVNGKKKVLVIEQEDFVSGKCFDSPDPVTGVLSSRFGAHFFHTNDRRVWNFVTQFVEFVPFELREIVQFEKKNRYSPWPPNIQTVNDVFGDEIEMFRNISQFHSFVAKYELDGYACPKYDSFCGFDLDNAEEDLRSKMCRFFANENNVIQIRENWDDRYYQDEYQGLPKHGYSNLVHQMLSHSNIHILLGTKVSEMNIHQFIFRGEKESGKIIFTAGSEIDSFFNKSHGEVQYTNVVFKRDEIFGENMIFSQPNSVIRHIRDRKYSRTVDYKLFPWIGNNDNVQKNSSVVVRYEEFYLSNKKHENRGVKYSMIDDPENIELAEKYMNLFTERYSNRVDIIGSKTRLFSMSESIETAFRYFEKTNQIKLPLSSTEILPDTPPNKRKTMNFIISRCEEDISFLRDYHDCYSADFNLKFFVIDKCGFSQNTLKTLPNYNIENIVLPNVGREGHTYLYFILHRSSEFADINFFHHGSSKGGSVRTTCVCNRNLREVIGRTIHEIANDDDFDKEYSFQFINLNFVIPFYDWESPIQKRRFSSYFCEFYKKIVVSKTHPCDQNLGDSQLIFSSQGEFMASKFSLFRLLTKHRFVLNEIYHKLRNGGSDPIEGFVLEHLWLLLFNGPHYWNTTNIALLNSICTCLNEHFCNRRKYMVELSRDLNCHLVKNDNELPFCLQKKFSFRKLLGSIVRWVYMIGYNFGKSLRDKMETLK